MSLKDLVTQAAELDNKHISSMLDKAYRDATNAKHAYESLKSHLVTATAAPDRVTAQLADIDKRIEKEIAAHEKAMRLLMSQKDQWSMPIEEAREQLEAAKRNANEAADLFRTLGLISRLNKLSTDIPDSAFDELGEIK